MFFGYNYAMDKRLVNMFAVKHWKTLIRLYPKLCAYECPKIVLCNRLTKTAGKSYQEERRIHLANKFFAKNEAEILAVILPHELIHQADFDLNGDSEKKCGHGKKWSAMMIKFGIPANKYHSMEL